MSERATVRYTYQDYLSIPEDTSRRHEIVGGELFVTPSPRFRHQQVVGNVFRILANLAAQHGLGEVATGPVTVHLHDEGVVEPDVIFVRADRLAIVDPEGAVHGPPDLVVEVLSPSNRNYDRGAKRKQYMEWGVAELWIADADARTVEVWRPEAEEPELVRDALEWSVEGQRFDVPLEEVFRG
jgi:Uma2 family endonuclease